MHFMVSLFMWYVLCLAIAKFPSKHVQVQISYIGHPSNQQVKSILQSSSSFIGVNVINNSINSVSSSHQYIYKVLYEFGLLIKLSYKVTSKIPLI